MTKLKTFQSETSRDKAHTCSDQQEHKLFFKRKSFQFKDDRPKSFLQLIFHENFCVS